VCVCVCVVHVCVCVRVCVCCTCVHCAPEGQAVCVCVRVCTARQRIRRYVCAARVCTARQRVRRYVCAARVCTARQRVRRYVCVYVCALRARGSGGGRPRAPALCMPSRASALCASLVHQPRAPASCVEWGQASRIAHGSAWCGCWTPQTSDPHLLSQGLTHLTPCGTVRRPWLALPAWVGTS